MWLLGRTKPSITTDRVYVAPYSMKSASAKLLADKLGVLRIRKEGSTYSPSKGDTIINWGRIASWDPATAINTGLAISNCTNKVRFFTTCGAHKDGPRIPWWSTSPTKAKEMHATGVNLVVREKVQSSGGKGAWILKCPPAAKFGALVQFPIAPLYTQFIDETTEFRVHVLDDSIIWRQQKLRKNGTDGTNLIRNYDNGWVFSSNLRLWEEDIGVQARKAIAACGLDFGAVDVLWSHSLRQAFVLEVNSAPGIEGPSLEAYATAFKKRIGL